MPHLQGPMVGLLQCTCTLLLVCVATWWPCCSSAAAAVGPVTRLLVHPSTRGSSSSSSTTSFIAPGRAMRARSAVPGQAFHDWRSSLIRAKFSQNSTVANPSTTTSSSSSGETHPQWINIVGLRDQLSTLPGPRAVNTTHPAAAQRLAIAKKVLQEASLHLAAAAEADAAAAAAAASAATTTATVTATADADAVLEVEGPELLQSGSPSQEQQQQQQRKLQQQGGGSSSGSSSNRPYPSEPELELTLLSYVTRNPAGGAQLQLNTKPWLMTGFDIPNALALATHESSRPQVLYAMNQARKLGFNTIRVWGFADGGISGIGSAAPTKEWQQQQEEVEQQQQQQAGGCPNVVLQPAPGILNATVMSAGLDWLIHVCGLHGLKVVLVLTNGNSRAHGGMQQYIDWVDPALTVTDFYTNDTVKSVFLDYVAALLSHQSSISGVSLREDPVIAGWQLTHAATHPGHPNSEPLLAWLKQVGTFLKEKAPHQLVLTGLDGYFGVSSPHHTRHNPHAQVSGTASRTLHAYSALCEGTDFWLHHQLPEIDVATAAVLPDKWLACDNNCKLNWARSWIRAHLRDAVRLQKPLLLSSFAALRPKQWRRQLLQLLQHELARAIKAGHPIAGAIISGISSPSAAEESGWAAYSRAEDIRKPTARADATQQELAWRRFMNHGDYLYCLNEVLRGEHDDDYATAAWTDGRQDMLSSVGGIGLLACALPGADYMSACQQKRAAGAIANTSIKLPTRTAPAY